MEIEFMSVYDAFDYVMNHYAPLGHDDDLLVNDTYAIISIQDAQSNGFGFDFTTSNFCKAVLTLRFDDVERKVKNATIFDEKMAEEIINFLDKWNDKVDTLIIHCYAGESRSRAVAAFAQYYLGLDNTETMTTGNPNYKVFETLMKQSQKHLVVDLSKLK